MKKLLSSVAVATLLMSNAMANQIQVNAIVSPFAVVSFGTAPTALNGINEFNAGTVSLGTNTPTNFIPVNTDVYARSNSDTATIRMALTDTVNSGNLVDASATNTIAMAYSYTQTGGTSISFSIGGPAIDISNGIGAANQGGVVGVFTATPTVANSQPAGTYTATLGVTITAV